MSPFVLKMYRFFLLHGGFLHITSFIEMLQALFFQIFKVHGFMNVRVNFFYWEWLMKDFIGV